jgi:hypothetical protein
MHLSEEQATMRDSPRNSAAKFSDALRNLGIIHADGTIATIVFQIEFIASCGKYAAAILRSLVVPHSIRLASRKSTRRNNKRL